MSRVRAGWGAGCSATMVGALLAALLWISAPAERTVTRVALGWSSKMQAHELQTKLKHEPERLVLAEFFAPYVPTQQAPVR